MVNLGMIFSNLMVKTQTILVGGFNHLEKYESQWEGLSHIIMEMFETTNQYMSIHEPVLYKTMPGEVCKRLHIHWKLWIP
jgi:hypothetical protein